VRERRQDLGLTQEQLGRRVGEGVRQSEISRLEKGIVSMPHPDRLIALTRALEVPLGELLLHTGMIEAYHRSQFDDVAGPTTSEDHAVQDAIGDLSDLLVDLAEGRARLAEGRTGLTDADYMMQQAEMVISSVLKTLNRNPYSEVRPPIGLVKRWETTAMSA
jgi:transcriptional regulator with XRE-family HTH domain